VDVDHPEGRDRQDLGAQNMPVRDDDAQIRFEVAQRCGEKVADGPLWLEDWDTGVDGCALDRGWDKRASRASLRPIRLGDDPDDLAPMIQQRAE
jgi:hypothetical protein